MSQRFAIPKKVVHARVSMPDRKGREIELFLGECAQSHAGGERVLDLLTSDARFIPVRDLDSQRVILLQRSSIMVLSFPKEHEVSVDMEDGGLLDSDLAQKFSVEVVLVDGSTLKGDLSFIMPEGMRRLQDFLNLPEPYLCLRDGETSHVVSKFHVTEIHTLQTEPKTT